jgi:hypothetical protein
MCLVHGFGESDKEGREREWNKHRLGNLKDASRGDQPFSAILREDAGNPDGREGLSGLSSPPTDSSSSRSREVSKIFSYRRHFKISYIIRAYTFIYHHYLFLFDIKENTNSHLPFTSVHRPQLAAWRKFPQFPNHHPPSCPPLGHSSLPPKLTPTTPSHPPSPPSPSTNHGSSSASQSPTSKCSAHTLGSWPEPWWAMRVVFGASFWWGRQAGRPYLPTQLLQRAVTLICSSFNLGDLWYDTW